MKTTSEMVAIILRYVFEILAVYVLVIAAIVEACRHHPYSAPFLAAAAWLAAKAFNENEK